LLLFGAVQITMIGAALVAGERPRALEWLGAVVALGGLVWLVLPGVSAPPLVAAALMITAGAAWGAYSLLGRAPVSSGRTPSHDTAWSFARAAPLALVALAIAFAVDADAVHVTPRGAWLAIASGAVTSGLGYVVWYAALRTHTATTAAIVQLAVPAVAALGGVVALDERVTPRLLVAMALVLGGIALAVASRKRAAGR
jgi:drug/metabolite transporter (DMT)-like permease